MQQRFLAKEQNKTNKPFFYYEDTKYFVYMFIHVLVGNFKSDNGALRNTCIKRLIHVMYY